MLTTAVPIPGLTYPKPQGRGFDRTVTVDFIDVTTEELIGSITITLESRAELPERIRREALQLADETGHTVFAVSETGEECMITPQHRRK